MGLWFVKLVCTGEFIQKTWFRGEIGRARQSRRYRDALKGGHILTIRYSTKCPETHSQAEYEYEYEYDGCSADSGIRLNRSRCGNRPCQIHPLYNEAGRTPKDAARC